MGSISAGRRAAILMSQHLRIIVIDCDDIAIFENAQQMTFDLEAIDVRNNMFVVFDEMAQKLELAVGQKGQISIRKSTTTSDDRSFLDQKIRRYLQSVCPQEVLPNDLLGLIAVAIERIGTSGYGNRSGSEPN